MEFIKRLKDRAPEYDASLEDLISRFTVMQGGRAGTATEKTQWEEGKFFHTKYEIYMYAALLGIKSDYSIPLTKGAETSKFIEIKSWSPSEVTDYILMGLIAKSDLDLNAIEDMEEKDVEKEITNLKKQLEEYANGGFDKIRAQLEKDPAYFESNDNCFLDFLDLD